jgi:hypothetical protein
VGEIVGAIAAILAGIALASGVAFTLTEVSAPDRGINFQQVGDPDPWAGATNYGER